MISEYRQTDTGPGLVMVTCGLHLASKVLLFFAPVEKQNFCPADSAPMAQHYVNLCNLIDT